MAVPNTDTFSLQDVVTEVVPTTNDLTDCFADADLAKFDASWKSFYYAQEGNLNNLLMFRNYGAVINPTIGNVGSATGSSFTFNLDLLISAGNTIAFVVINGYTSLGTITVTDNLSATWTHFSTPNAYQSIYYCNTMTTGTRTITVTTTGAFYLVGLAATLNNSPTTLTGTPTSTGPVTVNTTVTNSYTPRSTGSLLISIAHCYVNKFSSQFSTFGSGQTLIVSAGIGGGVAEPNSAMTTESTGLTSSDTQSATNSITSDTKYMISFDIIPV